MRIINDYEEALSLINQKKYNILFFGASNALSTALKRINILEKNSIYICDNDTKKHNTLISGYRIHDINELVKDSRKSFIVILTSMYIKEITKQIKNIQSIKAIIDHRVLPAISYSTIKTVYTPMNITYTFEYHKVEFNLISSDTLSSSFLDFTSYCNNYINSNNNPITISPHIFNLHSHHYKSFIQYLFLKHFFTNNKKSIDIYIDKYFDLGFFLQETKKALYLINEENLETPENITFTKIKEHALIIHLYYFDMLVDIFKETKESINTFDIYITIPIESTTNQIKSIKKLFPSSTIIPCENRGRDILPFLMTLEHISPLAYKSICKIHTKKSLQRREDGVEWGNKLRQSLFKNIDFILDSFEKDSTIGAYVEKNSYIPFEPLEPINQKNLKHLCKYYNSTYSNNFYFPMGSIFWFVPKAIEQLLLKPSNKGLFKLENGYLDGQYDHAFEYFIGQLIQNNHYKLCPLPNE